LDSEGTRVIRTGDHIVVEEFAGNGRGDGHGVDKEAELEREEEEHEVDEEEMQDARAVGSGSGLSEQEVGEEDDESKVKDGTPSPGLGHPTNRRRFRVDKVEICGAVSQGTASEADRVDDMVKQLQSHRKRLESGGKLDVKAIEDLRCLNVKIPAGARAKDLTSEALRDTVTRVLERIMELKARRRISITPELNQSSADSPGHRVFWHSPRRGIIQNNIHVIAGPRLETSEDLTVILRPGDVILLRLASPTEEESPAGLDAHIPMSSSSPSCSSLDDSSIHDELAQVTSRLRATRDRKEILSLMSRRTELLSKRDSATPSQTAGNPGEHMVIGLGPDDGATGTSLDDGVDDRAHLYTVVHVAASNLTVDRPVHANPDQQLVATWPQEMTFVPDSTETDGFLCNAFGLFPAPLTLPEDSNLNNPDALANWHFLGQIMAKALQDGFLVPLPLAPLFFKVVSGEAVDPTLLASPDSHMRGCSGETVACMMALLPDLRRAASDPKQMDALLAREYPFTGPGQTLSAFLADPSVPLEYSDPITGVALGGSEPSVHRHNLLSYLEAVADHWLGKGIERQVHAFRSGVSEVFDWKSLLAFSPRELCGMVCGTDAIDWTDKSLRKMLKPASGFNHESPTVEFLRSELIAMSNDQRQKFLKFATAVPRLVPDLTLIVACKGKGGSRLPTAQTCTPQINLPIYRSRQELRAALHEAIVHSEADGGFHEREAGSDGDTTGARDGGSGSGGVDGSGFSFGGGGGDMGHFEDEDEGSDMEEDENHGGMHHGEDDSSHDGDDGGDHELMLEHVDEDEDEDEPSRTWEVIHHHRGGNGDGDDDEGTGGGGIGSGGIMLGTASSLVDYLF